MHYLVLYVQNGAGLQGRGWPDVVRLAHATVRAPQSRLLFRRDWIPSTGVGLEFGFND